MSTPSIAHHLRDFGPAGGPSFDRAEPARGKEIEQAFARGLEQGQASARASLEAKLDCQQKQFESALAAERQARQAEAAKFAAALAAGFVSLERTIADSVGRLLRPFLAARARAQAVADLRAALVALLGKEPGIALTITGPEPLLAALRDTLPEAAIRYLANSDCEIRVTANETVLETRLGAWLAGLEEAGS
jgi:hypothetical protein